MSGGEQQRVAAARHHHPPALVLADEPTGALDSRPRGSFSGSSALNQAGGATILMVTHDAFTASWCRRILFIKDGGLYRELLRESRTAGASSAAFSRS